MTASNTTDSTAFDITDWLGEWESFEHYIDSDDAAIQQTWEAAEQAVLANPKMAPMAARGIRTFWSMACSTTSPENIIHIGYWRVNEPAAESGSTDDAALAIEWFAEDDTSLDTYEYTIDHVIEHGLEGSPTFVFHTTDPAAEDSPFRWLLAINPLPSRKAFAEGGLLSHLHFQYANDLHTLVATMSHRHRDLAQSALVRHHVRQRGNRRGPLRHHPCVAPLAVDLATYGSMAAPR